MGVDSKICKKKSKKPAVIRRQNFSIFTVKKGGCWCCGVVKDSTWERKKSMKFPNSTKPALWSAVGGVIAGMVLMSYGFGYTSPGSAEKVAQQRADGAVVAILAPGCAAKFRMLPDYTAKREALEKAAAYQRSDVIPKELTTLPGKSYTDSDLVAACSAEILKEKAASN
jgi:hypothetical protein